MKAVIVGILTCFVSSVFAEPKRLVCTRGDSHQESRRLSEAVDYYRKKVEKEKDVESYRDTIKNLLAGSESCARGLVDYGWSRTFTFDTTDLSRGQIKSTEMLYEGCNVNINSGKVWEGVELSTTISTLTFKWSGPIKESVNLQVDRKTLAGVEFFLWEGGKHKSFEYQCKVEDINISENLI